MPIPDLLLQSPPPPHPRGLVSLFQATGFAGPVLLLLGFVALVLAVRRWLELRPERMAPESLQRNLEVALKDGKTAGGLAEASASRTFLGEVVAGGLHLHATGLDEMLANAERTAVQSSLRFSNRIANLGRLGVVVLLVGLLGTVLGLMNSMIVIGALESPKAADFVTGIAESLACTALGLAIALGCYVAHLVLENRLVRRTLAAREIAEELLRAAAGGGRRSGA